MKDQLYLILLMLPFISQAQTNISGTVIGAENEPLIFANIMILDSKDSSLVTGTACNDEGKYTLNITPNFNGIIQVTALGYADQFVQLTHIRSVYNFQLETNAEILDEVVVSARKSMFELKEDRLVMNVSSMPSLSGDNALQVLQKSPGVLVQENNSSISLNGNGEVLIMINNRISRIPRDVLINQLRGMQADNIEKIEIIHQPGAKYDADNTGGIIHIVMKKNNQVGLNGNATLGIGYGEKEKANGTLNLNYRKNKFNLYSSVSGNLIAGPTQNINHFREYTYAQKDYYFENEFQFLNQNQSLNFSLGADLEISNRTILGALIGYTTSRSDNQENASDSKFYENDLLVKESNYISSFNNSSRNNFVNLICIIK